MDCIEMRFTDMGSNYHVKLDPTVRIMTTKEAAKYLQVHPVVLNKWRMEHRGPAYIKIEGSIRYRFEDLEVWLFRNRVESQ